MGPLTQEDPIGLAGGLNLYGFANGDPINFSDPFGLCPWCLAAAAGAAIDGGLRVASNALAGRDLSDGVLQAAAVGAVAGAAGFGIGKVVGRGLVAARKTVGQLVRPNGKPIGTAGSRGVREVVGGIDEATAFFDDLVSRAGGGSPVEGSTYPGTLLDLESGGRAGLRTTATKSPGTAATIDLNVPGIDDIRKIKFNPGGDS